MDNSNTQLINSDVSIRDTARKMINSNSNSIVVAKNQMPVGIVTYKDFVMRIAEEIHLIDDVPIETIMSAPLVHCVPEQPVWEVADLMNTRGIKKIPIIDEYDKLLGTVNITDLLKAFSLEKK